MIKRVFSCWLFAASLAPFPAIAGVGPQPQVSLSPGATAGAGETFVADLTFSTGSQSAGAYSMTITWDPTVLSFLSLQAGPTAFGAPLAINPQVGSVQFNDVDPFGVGPIPIGSEALLGTISFTVIGSPGQTSALDLTVDVYADELGGSIPHETNDGDFTVASSTVAPAPVVAGLGWLVLMSLLIAAGWIGLRRKVRRDAACARSQP